jgi:toxin ParE1/3/4
LGGRVDATRELVIPRTPYVVAYTIVDEQVMILSVMHGARRWPDHF